MVIKYICSTLGTEKMGFYMIVDETNVSLISGIEKADFLKCGNVIITKIMKVYRFEKT